MFLAGGSGQLGRELLASVPAGTVVEAPTRQELSITDRPGVLRTLEIARLQRRQDGKDPLDAAAARRILAHVFSYTAFYETRRYLAEKRPRPALAMLAVADAIQPDGLQVCLGRARAYALSGQQKEGRQALACLLRSGRVSAAFVSRDPGLAPLRQGEAYKALMGRWPAPSP